MTGVSRRGTVFVTKWGSRIFRERFDLELPNFTRTFMSPPTALTWNDQNIHTDELNSHTRYDITGYFRLAVIEIFFIKKTVENAT